MTEPRGVGDNVPAPWSALPVQDIFPAVSTVPRQLGISYERSSDPPGNQLKSSTT